MKSISYAIKKKVVNEFYNLLKVKLQLSYYELDNLKYLSKRKVFSLLKLSFESKGVEYDKRALKDISLVLSKLDFQNISKREVKSLYRTLLKRDINFLVKKMIGCIYFALFELLEFRDSVLTKISNFINVIFKSMRILLI